MSGHMYVVGKLANPKLTRYEEGTNYNFRENAHELLIAFRNPRPIEVQAIKTGEANFGLVVKEDVILLVFRFGSIPWSDASYTIHRVPTEQRTLPQAPEEIGEQERATITTFLINADTGILLAIRYTSFSHDFTVKLHQAIIEQSKRPYDNVLFDRQLRKLYSQHDSKSLLSLAIARCKGGE